MATTPLPLNKFRLLATNLASGSNLIYSSSLDVSTIVLSCQITNLSANTQYTTVQLAKSGSVSKITLLKDGAVPVSESLSPLAGKLVLEKGDQFYITSAVSGSLDAVLSVLENANN
jgi:hypothetical protein